ncbi:MAG: cytochrome c-type biogenesis protein CcmH [Thermoleophilia bacterium]
MLSRALVPALLVAILLAPAQALATAPRADLVDVEDEVMCVTCKVPLNIAEGAQPDSQRALIRELIDQGMTKAQIKRELVAEYGPEVLALPRDDGFGLTAYAIPLALGAFVLAALGLLVPRWRRRPAAGMTSAARSASPGSTPALGADDARRLDEDLARYEG